MKIVYFYQFFSSPKGSWGTRVYEFAKRWVAQGHQVTVITSVFYKSDLQARGLVSTQDFDGIQTKILNVGISNKHPFYLRVWTFLLYGFLSTWYALTLKADVVVASSGPITVGFPGLVARYLRRRKLVFEVRDLWPEGAVALGILRNPIIKKLAYGFERSCYRASSLIVALSPGMAHHIKTEYGINRLLSVPNTADNDLFGGDHGGWQFPDWVAGRKVALYAGNIGEVNNSQLLLEAAKILHEQGRQDILILLIGDGQLRDRLKSQTESLGLPNMVLMDLIPKHELAHWVRHGLCSLVPLQGIPVLDTSSPNKLFDSLAAGVPVVQTTGGWLRELLEQYQCGLTVSPHQPAELAAALCELADDPDRCKTMGANGRKLAQEQFDKGILAAKMLAGLEKVHRGEEVTFEAETPHAAPNSGPPTAGL